VSEVVRRTYPIAGVLLRDAADPFAAARALDEYVLGRASPLALEEAGIPRRRATELSALLPSDAAERRAALELGAAWAMGARSMPSSPDMWYPVLSGLAGDGQRFRATAETVISLIMTARRTLQLFAPYIDRPGVTPLVTPIRQAAQRGVAVTIAFVAKLDRGGASRLLEELVGETSGVALRSLESGDRFPHLKVVMADGARAYVGSANLTWGGLVTNLEIGALVEGAKVAVLEDVFASLLTAAALEEPSTP
jgi:phosphatidylserine/phosphatidylglycerophosphate/cardiolipin synthase-like enzyme